MISAFSNVTFTSLISSTVRTLDRRTSWAPHRDSIKASALSSKEPPLASTQSFWEWMAPYTTITRWSLLRSWVLIFNDLRLKKLVFMLHVHSVIYAAKLVHTRRALSSTIINSHQETISGQACTPLDPHWFFSCSLVEEFYDTWYQNGSFFLMWGVVSLSA